MLDSNFTQQHVLIMGDGSMFDKDITQLLTDESSLFVSHAIYSEDLAFLNMIRPEHRPEVIVINESGLLDMARILHLLSSRPKVMGMRLVVVRLYKNMINVYARPIFFTEKMFFRPRRIIPLTDHALLNTVRRKHNGQFQPIRKFAQSLRAIRPVFETVRNRLNTRFVENMRGDQDRAPLYTNLKENSYEEMQ